MTDEEKMKFLSSLGASGGKIQVIMEQNIENNIEKVEDGGIAVQNNYYGSASKPNANKRKKASDSPTIVSTTFSYKYYNDRLEQVRLAKFYQQLQKGGLIAEDTDPEQFGSIFSGKTSENKVKWLGKQTYLWYLIKILDTRKLITYDGDIWVITQSHFVNDKSKMFEGFNKLHEPKRAVKMLNALADILDPSVREEE